MSPRYRFGRYRIFHCRNCALGRLHPLPSRDEQFRVAAAAKLRALEGEATPLNRDLWARTCRARLGRLLEHGAVHRMLELSCGDGVFLENARDIGITRSVGLEPHTLAFETARQRGLDIRHGWLEALDHDEHFDAAVMLDGIEHVADPIPFLARVRHHLQPGGRLLLTTPNLRSFLAMASGRRWVSYKVPQHVFYYSPRSVRSLLQRAGYDVLETRRAGQYVTFPVFVDRLSRIAPRSAQRVERVAHALRLQNRVLFINNGAMDVVARRR